MYIERYSGVIEYLPLWFTGIHNLSTRKVEYIYTHREQMIFTLIAFMVEISLSEHGGKVWVNFSLCIM